MTQQEMNQEVDKNLFRFAGRELAGGGDRTPLTEFIGTLNEWDVRPSPFGDGSHQIVLKFSGVQVISVRDGSGPYPFDSAEVAIKHSGSERSGFGILVSSMDKALSVNKLQSDMDNYLTHEWHFKTDRFNWGKIPGSTAADENGDTWGDVWTATTPGSSNAFVEAPTAVAEAPAPVKEALTAEEIAFSLLNGKTQSEWIPDVVSNTTIQQDMSLFQSIMSNQWLASKIASGEVTRDGQDRHHVIN